MIMNKFCNEVIISGVINVITDINDKHIKFGIVNDDKSFNKVYVSLDIERNLYNYYKDYFFIGNKVFIKGYLNSFIDKDKKIQSFITTTAISNNSKDINRDKKSSHIRYDLDGVMVWNGKRCESEIATEEEMKEMKIRLGGLYDERR